MQIDTFIDNLTEKISLDSIINLADDFEILHDEADWSDMDFLDKENELRMAVADAMRKVGKDA